MYCIRTTLFSLSCTPSLLSSALTDRQTICCRKVHSYRQLKKEIKTSKKQSSRSTTGQCGHYPSGETDITLLFSYFSPFLPSNRRVWQTNFCEHFEKVRKSRKYIHFINICYIFGQTLKNCLIKFRENKKPPLLSQHEVYKYQSSIRLNIPASHCEAANEKWVVIGGLAPRAGRTMCAPPRKTLVARNLSTPQVSWACNPIRRQRWALLAKKESLKVPRFQEL